MRKAIAVDQSPYRMVRAGPEALSQPLRQRRRVAVRRKSVECIVRTKQQSAVGSTAKSVRLLQYRVKHWREIAGRGVDDLQYLGRAPQ